MAGKPKIIRGMDSIVYVNGRVWAVVTGYEWTADYGEHEIVGIDVPRPQEIAPGQATVAGTLEVLRHRNTGAAEGQGLVPMETGAGELTRGRYFFLQIVDRMSDTVILQIPKAKLTSQSWSTKARGVTQGTINFKGIGFANEF